MPGRKGKMNIDPTPELKMSAIEHNGDGLKQSPAMKGYLNNPKWYAYGLRLKGKGIK